MRSNDIMNGPKWANVRALYRAAGFSDEEMEKPKIAIINAFNGLCPGHVTLRQVSARAADGVRAGGGLPMEFGTIGACDGIAMGHEGMRYVLPTREMIAADIEAMVQAHRLDGLVLVGSCDKIVPGMLMAAVRLNLPALFIGGGPALPGHMRGKNIYGGESIDHSSIQQAEGMLASGEISAERFDWIERNAMPTAGSCAMLGTANTMCCLAEAMGMALPESAAVPATYSRRMALAYESGLQVMELLKQNLLPRDIVTKRSLENAIKINAAIGGSTNAVMHLMAIAYEAHVPLDLFELGRLGDGIPHLVPLIPAGSYTLLDFFEAGGVSTVMAALENMLHLDVVTCKGETVGEVVRRASKPGIGAIRGLDNPVGSEGGVAILRGNLAPDGAVTKPSAIPTAALVFEGPARIYEGEEQALAGIRSGQVKKGEVVVIRGEGPKGGPGMPEMYKAMKLLVGMGLGKDVCLITDGRFSGSNNGCFVGHICPEAADGGPIAFLQPGDRIRVDVPARRIDALDIDFARRLELGCSTFKARSMPGLLYQYAHNVLPASMGAVVPSRPPEESAS